MLLRTLGNLALDGTALRRPKPLLLLSYLALEGATPRRRLAELFFGEAKDPADSLSTALGYLKQHPASALEIEGQTVATGVACDAKGLLHDLEHGDFAAALARYRGPFLAPLALVLGEELEGWVYGTREYLARSVRGALLHLAEAAAEQGQLAPAAHRAEEAYTLMGAPELEPEEIVRVYEHLAAANHPRAATLRREAEELGIALAPVAARERRPRAAVAAVAGAAASAGAAHNLPGRPTAFVGRDLELVEIATLLAQHDCRLLTLTGPGGIGKTRLALQAGWEAAQNDPGWGGVYFASLESVASPELVLEGLARAFGLELRRRVTTLSTVVAAVVEAVGDRPILLILDNFEHLPDATPIVAELLKELPNLKVLVTSRERLHLEAEWVLSVAGLPVPEGGADEDAAREDAVQLFVQRAKRASLRFALTPEHAPHVREICRAVGGSPLAIELAAAWVRMFSPAEIAREVAHDLDFLSTASRSAPARHRSVRAAFEHSWRLLKPREQAVLGGLSVFHGGFQRDAAGTVLGATLATLASLVDKSLLRVAPGGRYDRHPLIYAYLREKLDERERVRLQGLHAAFYLELADALDARLQGPDDARELEVFEREHENLRAAGRWALTQAGDLALRLGGALGRFWEVRGYLGEGRAYLEEALARAPGAPAAVQARALIPLGRLTQLQGDLPQAEARFARALELARRAGDEESVAAALNRLGTAALDRESYAEAEACFREALDLYRALGDKGGMSILLNNLGEMARAQNDFRRARELYEASLALHGETGNTRRRALVLGNLGFVSWRLGETAQAEVFQKESLALKYEVRDEIGLSYCFAGLAAVSCELGGHGRAALLLGVVDALVARTKHQLDLVDRNDVQRTLEAVRATLGFAAFVAAQARGRTLSLGEAVAYALAAPPEQGAPSADEGASV